MSKKVSQSNALPSLFPQLRMLDGFAGVAPAGFWRIVVLLLIGFIIALPFPASPQSLQTGLHYYAVVDLNTGQVVQRGKAGANGYAFDQLILAPNTPYRIMLLQASSLWVAQQSLSTPNSGSTFNIPQFTLVPSVASDTDRDGLPDDGELIMGTDPNNPDTDGDGIPDGAEVQQGLDPLSGLVARTGIIGTVLTPGPAIDVCAINNMAIVAMGTNGVGVYNIFNGLDPVSISQVDTPGDARRVACFGSLIAVADGPAGLAVIDISTPASAKITRQINFLGGNVISVTTAGDIAIVGMDSGTIAAVDMLSGAVLAKLLFTSPVLDLVFGGDILYVLTRNDLHAIQFDAGSLTDLSSIATGNGFNQRLFVGGGIAYTVHQNGYDTFDLSTPGRPSLIKATSDIAFGWRQIVLNGSGSGLAAVGALLSSGPAVDVSLYDTSDPKVTTKFLATFPTPGVATALSIFNGLVYVADDSSGLQVINYLPYDNKKQPPTIQLQTNFPQNKSEEGKLFVLTANVADDVQVRNVEFYVDGQLIETDGNFPFELRMLTPLLTAGKSTFTIQAIASDTGGNRTSTLVQTIQIVPDATPPKVGPTPPTSNGFSANATSIGAAFNEAIDVITLTTNSFTLLYSGRDRRFGTADDQIVAGLLSYDPNTRTATLSFGQPLPPGRYQATIHNTITDVAGNALVKDVSWAFDEVAGLDSDGDGLTDAFELQYGLDPKNPDENKNGIPDSLDDFDGDGLINGVEMMLGLDPKNPRTFNNTPDAQLDRDGDFLPDYAELKIGSDWLNADTDGDGWNDEAEVTAGSDPLVPNQALNGLYLATPVVNMLASGDASANGGSTAVVVATPVVNLLASKPSSFGTGTVVATPVVDILLAGTQLGQALGSGPFVATPVVSLFLNGTSGTNNLAAGIFIATPPVIIQIGP